MMSDVPWPWRTARLRLRPATPDDAAAVWEYARLPEVSEWIAAAPETLEAFEEWYLQPDRLPRILVAELDGRVVGHLKVVLDDAWAQVEVQQMAHQVQAEIGWVFSPEVHGRGLATEAVRGLLEICFDGLGLRRVTAGCFVANTASWRLMERIGMRREIHTISESLHRSGEWCDGLGYALLADEWRSASTG